ncbi:MAG: pilus assembly PilX N-terminal domain-containing protein [Bacteroidales bacterium]|nr:pilus assembly PilX N-terminal domain-containing protein [Bacteroidales bacterium]
MMKKEKGMALVATIIFVAVLTSFALAILSMTGDDSKLSTLHRESTRAFYLAEAGIEKSLWLLNTPVSQGGKGIKWRTDESGTSDPYHSEVNSGEFFDVTVETTTEPSPGIPEIVSIVSTGTVTGSGDYDKGTRKIKVNLRKGISPSPYMLYNYAIMTYAEDSNLVFNGHVEVEGDIHSNGDITGNGWDPDADVDGNISYAGDSTAITGENVSPAGVESYPSIDFEYYEANAAVVYDDDTAYEIGDEVLNGIHYFKGDVTISSDLLVIGTIVVEGNITVQGNPDITLLPDAEISLVMANTGDIVLNGNVHIEGIVHSEGTITFNGTTNIEEGAVLAADGTINGTGADTKIVYDVTNQEKPVPGTGIEVWKKDSWREI